MESAQIISEKDYKWQLQDGWIPDQDYVFVSYSSRNCCVSSVALYCGQWGTFCSKCGAKIH